MTSGIYMLTFPSGNRYIGKSINLEKRWEQHRTSMSKGTHTKLLQREFDIYQIFNAKVLFECHPDHIDIMEACFISRLQPELNGVFPADPLLNIQNESFDYFTGFMNESTVEHINRIALCTIDMAELEAEHQVNLEKAELESKVKVQELKDKLYDALDKLDTLEETIGELEYDRSEEEIIADVSKRIIQLEATAVLKDAEVKNLTNRISNLVNAADSLEKENRELLAYKNLPWYKKIFK